MARLLDPAGAAASILAHLASLKRERAFIAAVYRDYEGLKSLDDALAEAGALEEVKAIAEGEADGR